MATTDAPPDLLHVEPIHRSIGAVIHGVDAHGPLDDRSVALIRQALLDHKVVFLRDQFLSYDEQLAFAQHFGDAGAPHPIGDYPDLEWLESAGIRVRAENWHADLAFLPDPPYGSILSLPIQPEHGGDTLWADLEAAYLGLAEPVRQLVDGLVLQHLADNFQEWAWGPNVNEEQRNAILSWAARPVDHPLVQVHPETGRKTLYAVTGFAQRIHGLSEEESDAILALLAVHATRPEYVVRWQWRPGDIAFWDNRAVLHRLSNDYGDQPRQLQRVTVA